MHFLVFLSALVACAAGVPLNSTNPRVEGRIVGGSLTTIRSVPYQVSLRANGSHICGGSIIHPNWVITARHCLEKVYISGKVDLYPPDNITVRSGSLFSRCFGTIHNAAKIIRHEDYNSQTLEYDVALVKVTPQFTPSGRVRIIALQQTEVPEGSIATVSGWGRRSLSGSSTVLLRKLSVDIFNIEKCNLYFSFIEDRVDSPPKVTANKICAGNLSGGQDVCKGDSGGPLVVDNKLVGITSYGPDVKCGSPFSPSVYTKVSAVRDWIEANAV